MALSTLHVCWLAFTIVFVLPFVVLVVYTLNTIFPLLAAVEDIESSSYGPLALGSAFNLLAYGPSGRPNDQDDKPRPISSSIRSMAHLLYSREKYISLLRGIGPFILWNLIKGSAYLATYKLPTVFTFAAQILIPGAFFQLHTLWTHTVIGSSDRQPFWRRIVPAREVFKTIAPPLFILLSAEAIALHILIYTYQTLQLRLDYILLVAQPQELALFLLVLGLVEVALVAPGHLSLVRVEASILPDDQPTIIPLDSAIMASRSSCKGMSLADSWNSVSRVPLVNLSALYFRIYALTLASAIAVQMVEAPWGLLIALSSWKF